ncbi:MAG: rod shape-determining protein RodA [Patescibacteria group bacterium]
MSIFQKLKSLDWIMIFAILGIVLFSCVALYSIGLGRESASFLNRQLIALAIGSGGMLFLAFINYRLLKNVAIPVYLLGIALLVAVLFVGENVRGTRGWFFIGEFGFQPAEFAKIALIVGLARYFSSWTRQIGRFRTIALRGGIAFLPVLLILLQPDFGSAVIVFAIWFCMILVSGMPKKTFVGFLALFIVLFAGAWLFLFQDYQKERIISFLSPHGDSAGAGYNVRQAQIAIGGGQLIGTGIGAGSGSQLRFLPEAQTDFIFSVIAEELGFVGVAALLLFWLLFFYRLVALLRRVHDDFAAFIVLGSLVVFFSQFVINIGGNLGLIPITGLVLPFVSYGGSSIVISLLLVGLIQGVRVHSA